VSRISFSVHLPALSAYRSDQQSSRAGHPTGGHGTPPLRWQSLLEWRTYPAEPNQRSTHLSSARQRLLSASGRPLSKPAAHDSRPATQFPISSRWAETPSSAYPVVCVPSHASLAVNTDSHYRRLLVLVHLVNAAPSHRTDVASGWSTSSVGAVFASNRPSRSLGIAYGSEILQSRQGI